jgi:2-isopropylmalate synthase
MSPPDSYVRVFDTTLRDGEQSPGATMTAGEKLTVARALSRLGVDVIEAGFPAASRDDFAAVRRIAETVGNEVVPGRLSPEPPCVCGLARAAEGDIARAFEAVRAAARPRLHTFLATSPIHREHKLRMSTREITEKVSRMVAYARGLCDDVEFSPEDAGRTEPEFLYEVLAAALRAGATTLNIPDTVGYMTPDEFGELISGIRKNVPGVENVIVSVHCHDDLGLATANALAGVLAGARQVEVTINGIGERAGNTALEELVMTLHTRKALLGLSTGIDTTQLVRTSKIVSTCTGMLVQPNKAVVGANAFAHEAGIHQDGMLKNKETYEIMRPEAVGAGATRLVLGKHSGRHAFVARLRELGYELEGEDLEQAFVRFKELADKKKNIADANIEALIGAGFVERERFSLDAMEVDCGTVGTPTAKVRLVGPDGTIHTRTATGTGPVDAVFRAIDEVVRVSTRLLEYSVQSVTEGIDALGEVSVQILGADSAARLNPQNGATSARVFHGHGADTDIIVASAKAYLAAVNRMISALEAPSTRAESPGPALASRQDSLDDRVAALSPTSDGRT